MSDKTKTKSPLGLRLFIWSCSILLGLLLIWLLDFVIQDIGRYHVDDDALNARFLSPQTLERQKSLQNQIADTSRRIQAGQERETFLKDSVRNSQETMRQMLALQRADLDSGRTMDEDQRLAVESSKKAFLENQALHQEQLDDLQTMRSKKHALETERQTVDNELKEKRSEMGIEKTKQIERLRMKAAFLKILILLPVIALAVWLLLKQGAGRYAPIVYAVDAAVLWKLVMVIHEYFPSRYFKYVFVIAAILVVLKLMLVMIKTAANPARNILLKRYREAYQKGQCPVCAYPVRRGEGVAVQIGRRGKRTNLFLNQKEGEEETPYTCPSCGQGLFETCPQCEKVRHTLLPNCRHCGAEKEAETPEKKD